MDLIYWTLSLPLLSTSAPLVNFPLNFRNAREFRVPRFREHFDKLSIPPQPSNALLNPLEGEDGFKFEVALISGTIVSHIIQYL